MIFLFSQAWALYQPTWRELRSDEGWTKRSQLEGAQAPIEVYAKEIDALPCFQARSTTQLPPQLILEIAADAESAVQWSSAGLLEGETLARTKAYVDYYQYLKIPFISDRFWILRGYFEESKLEGRTVHTFRWEPIESRYDELRERVLQEHSGAVETEVNLGAWVVLAPEGIQEPPLFEIRYYICTHPGGNIPTYLQSLGTEHTLPNNIEELLKEGKRRLQK
jgi:hypothetical protein